MQAGKLDQRITIEERTDTRNAQTGDVVKTWSEFASCWAEFEPISARELIRVRQFSSEITTRFKIRWQPGINNTMRVVHDGTTYALVEVIPDKRRSITMLGFAAQPDT